MCGIAEFLGRWKDHTASGYSSRVQAMLAPMRHRGPDDAGQWIDLKAGVALGYRRLSGLDLSEAGHQPTVSSCGSCVLSYNGKIYNDAELRAELSAAGQPFRGHSDCEVLVEACATWGSRRPCAG